MMVIEVACGCCLLVRDTRTLTVEDLYCHRCGCPVDIQAVYRDEAEQPKARTVDERPDCERGG